MRSTYQTYLMYQKQVSGGTSMSYEKLIDIKSFPDLGGNPERLDATTLSDPMRVYIEGIQDTEEIVFEANYSLDAYKKLKDLKGKALQYAVWLGADASAEPDGHDGKFEFTGTLSCKVTGGGVNEVAGLSITITPNTVIELGE